MDTVRGVKTFAFPWYRCTAKPPCDERSADVDTDDDKAEEAAYLSQLSAQIDSGLKDWTRFSLAITKALFDPQARRTVQNYKCRNRGDSETDKTHANCENDVGLAGTLLSTTDDYLDEHLLFMLGFTKEDVEAKSWWQDFLNGLDDLLGKYLDPIREVVDSIEAYLADYVKKAIRDATGVDVDAISDFLKRPARWMCGTRTEGDPVAVPGAGSFAPGRLFTSDEHRRFDDIMGLPADHHAFRAGLPTDCSPLRVSAQYDPNKFAPIKDSITQAKLLLLNGTVLDDALGEVLFFGGVIKSTISFQPSVRTYQAADNVMFTALGAGAPPWLDLIDGDHAWRANGLPRFCDFLNTTMTSSAACVRQQPGWPANNRSTKESSTGGTGQYPLWESCVLRPAFRALFTDWENGTDNFPDLGDGVSPDTAADPTLPTPTARPSEVTSVIDGKQFVLPDARFTVTGHDDVFTDQMVKVAYRTYPAGTAPGPFQDIPNGGTFTLPFSETTPTGDWVVETVATDPCGSQTRSQTFGIA